MEILFQKKNTREINETIENRKIDSFNSHAQQCLAATIIFSPEPKHS